MIGLLVLVLIIVQLNSASSSGCSFPAPAAGFEYKQYEGRWFEIGKIQTKGGAVFEKDCVCTELNISMKDYATGDGIADNDCRDTTIDGRWTNATGSLYNGSKPPGKWLESFYGGSPVNYTVIAIGTDYAVEYDCGTNNGITNYCVHVMSKTRTMDETLYNELFQMAEDMGLNPNDLPIQKTMQAGCV